MSVLAIIGGGQLGSRHLQALTRLEGQHHIFVVDPVRESLERARLRFAEAGGDARTHLQLMCTESFTDLPGKIDVAIVATNSAQRREAIFQTRKHRQVSHLILEKVLFSKTADYEWAERELEGLSAYVNCPLRMMDWPKKFRHDFGKPQKLVMYGTGSALGLGCNSIHYIDLFSFLTGRKLLSVSTKFLENRIVRSKRAGYFEVFGELVCDFGEGNLLTLHSLEKGDVPCSIAMLSPTFRYDVQYDQSGCEGRIRTATESSRWEWVDSQFKLLRQSELSHLVVEDLLRSGKCELTPLLDSLDMHVPLVSEFRNFFSRFSVPSEEGLDCPIT